MQVFTTNECIVKKLEKFGCIVIKEGIHKDKKFFLINIDKISTLDRFSVEDKDDMILIDNDRRTFDK